MCARRSRQGNEDPDTRGFAYCEICKIRGTFRCSGERVNTWICISRNHRDWIDDSRQEWTSLIGPVRAAGSVADLHDGRGEEPPHLLGGRLEGGVARALHCRNRVDARYLDPPVSCLADNHVAG